MDSSQEWTRGEIVTTGNQATWFELRCHQTLLRRIHYVSFDNGKKGMVAPDWEPIGKGRLYFYRADSVDYAVQRFWAEHDRRDDSKGLGIGGDGEPARAARSRWRRGLDIPIVRSGELHRFMEDRVWNTISSADPSSDPDEQYDLFLRAHLNFDDWRQAQGPT